MRYHDSAGCPPIYADRARDALHKLLRCPRCRAALEPGGTRCPRCGYSVAGARGGLDLLDEEQRGAAERFGAQYTVLRQREGWIGPSGREDPDDGEPRLWDRRLKAISKAVAALRREWAGLARPVVIDVGSGGGWFARYLREADVIAVDLLDVEARPGVLQVRGDMRRLPVGDATADAAVYSASLHYAHIEDSILEAARVLRPGGVLIALDSPMYRDRRAQARARVRSAAYYTHAGFPDLAEHYHPIDVTSLRIALVGAGFGVIRLDAGGSGRWWWERPSFLMARLDQGNA